MTDQITIEQALELVEFEHRPEGWRVKNVEGSVYGDVLCNVWGNVGGTINGRRWKFAETPEEEFNQLEPPSLKEQALAVLEDANLDAVHYNTILRALEALPDD